MIKEDLENLMKRISLLELKNEMLKSQNKKLLKELEDSEVKDRLAELEKVMLNYYLAKGYQAGVGGWHFIINISTSYKRKEIQIMFRQDIYSNFKTVFRIDKQSTKEMFDEAFEHFNIVEAIEELEDLQNRSCENCKYNKGQDGFMIFCDKKMCKDGSKMMWHSFTKDFYCKYWEQKILGAK